MNKKGDAYPELQPQPGLAAHPHEPAQVHLSPLPLLQLQGAADWASAAFLPHWHPEPQPIVPIVQLWGKDKRMF